MKIRLVTALLAAFLSTGAIAQDAPAGFADAASAALQAYPSAGLAVVRIENGAVAWSGYAGEQGPGVPASASTLFNTASIAKTVTAELVLRLAEAGKLSLHEPVSNEYVHPDLADDPRYELLTPAILLSHQAGLKNWPYNYEDGRLAFIQDPGTGFTYSGAGYEILAEFAARRMDASFAELVHEWVLKPAGVENDVSLGAAGMPADRLATPMQRGEAVYDAIGDAEMPPSAADNLFVTAPAYARLLIAMMEETPLTGEAANARTTSVLDSSDHAPCTMDDTLLCPIETGQSLGWSVADFEESRYVFHSGSDWGENAIVVYNVTSRDGWVVIVSGGNGMGVWLDLMQTVAPDHDYFRFVRSLPQVQQMLAALQNR